MNNLERNNKTLLYAIEEIKKNDSIKKRLPFNFEQNDKIMSIIFQSCNFNESIICKNTQIFNEIENMLYKKQPEAKRENNIFLANGSIVYKYNTIEENKIKDGDVISVNIKDLNDLNNI